MKKSLVNVENYSPSITKKMTLLSTIQSDVAVQEFYTLSFSLCVYTDHVKVFSSLLVLFVLTDIWSFRCCWCQDSLQATYTVTDKKNFF